MWPKSKRGQINGLEPHPHPCVAPFTTHPWGAIIQVRESARHLYPNTTTGVNQSDRFPTGAIIDLKEMVLFVPFKGKGDKSQNPPPPPPVSGGGFVFIHRPSLTYLHSSRHKMALRRVIVTDTWPRAAFGLTLTSHVYRDSGPPSENAICIIYPIHHQRRAARNFGVFCVILHQQMECRSPTMLR